MNGLNVMGRILFGYVGQRGEEGADVSVRRTVPSAWLRLLMGRWITQTRMVIRKRHDA